MFADGSILGSIMFLESFFSPWLRVTLGGENKFVQWGLGGGEIKAWKFVFIFPSLSPVLDSLVLDLNYGWLANKKALLTVFIRTHLLLCVWKGGGPSCACV